jgi:Viral BACON domain/Divergent InlB B-repeat domain
MTHYGKALWRGAAMKFSMHRCYASLLAAVTTLPLISIPVFVGAQASSVAGWDLVGAVESPESGKIEVYLMGGLVKGPFASREFLEKVVWQKDGKTITAKNVVDCHSKVRKMVLLNEYKRHRVDDSDLYSLVRSQEPKDPAMKVEPDTLAEMIYNEVCLSAKFNSNVVPVDAGVVPEQPYQKEHGQQSASAVPDRGADVAPPSAEVSERPSPGCTYSISPGGQSFSSSGESAILSVSTQNNCQWTASTNAAWVIIDSMHKGSDNNTIRFFLSANPSAESRTAQITVEGQEFSITQAGNPESVEYTLTVRKTGNGRGTVTTNPAGILFRKGTSVTLNAVSGVHSAFSGWSGACSGTAQTCSIKIISATSVTASFSLRTFTISVSPSSNGTIYPPGPVRAVYGEELTFQMFPLPGCRVSDVLVDRASVGVVNSYRFKSIAADHVIQATFVKE